MQIAVLGTGMVGRTIAGKLASIGHKVTIGTRDPKATLERNEKDMMGSPPFREWHKDHSDIGLATFADATAKAELAVCALSGKGVAEALSAVAEGLAGKILIDISNPLDFSKGMPPSLTVCNTDSLGEQNQKTVPKAKVVKTLNTVNASLMVNPGSLAGADHTMFVCGNDADAKAQVTGYLKEWFGWKDIIDLGDITNARGTEMVLPIWVRLYGALKTPMFNMKVIR